VRVSGIWVGVASAVALALIGTFLEIRSHAKRTPKAVPSVVREMKSSGFTIKGEVKLEPGPNASSQRVESSIWATGPMFGNEVLLFEGFSTLVLPNGNKRVFGPIQKTFKDRLEASMFVDKAPPGSVVQVQGTARLFRREYIKVERQRQPDGSLRLYMNTGTVTFRRISGSSPVQMEVLCEKLLSVHEHGMELMAKDKKTVSQRLLLSPGRQVIERETTPYAGVTDKLEPVFVWQLIPKRSEPINIVLEVPTQVANPNQNR
jgi:hypothetical protein